MPKSKWMVLALMAATAAAQTGGPKLKAGSQTVLVPFAETPDFEHLLHVRLSINGAAAESFVVDTGSTGIVVGASSVPNFDPNGPPGELTYSSSGAREVGVWQSVEVRFADAKFPDGSPVVAHVKVLAVTRIECTGQGVNAASCHPNDAPKPHMMGIGFGRGTGATFDGQNKNPAVMLDAMKDGSLRRAYELTPKGLQLGLRPTDLDAKWAWQKLSPVMAVLPASYFGALDWKTAPGTFAVNAVGMPMGTILMDTGLINMMVATPGQESGAELAHGTAVKIELLGGQVSYSFLVGDAKTSTTPTRVSWVKPTHGVYVNTGLHAFSVFDYVYDAEEGYLGLRARKP